MNAKPLKAALIGLSPLFRSAALVFLPQPARAGCGVDDCSGSTYPYAHTCCRPSIRCEIFSRRICSISPAGFEYRLDGGGVGDCVGGTAPPGDPSQAACRKPTAPGGGD